MSTEKKIKKQAVDTLKSNYLIAVIGFILLILLFFLIDSLVAFNNTLVVYFKDFFDNKILWQKMIVILIKALAIFFPALLGILLSPLYNGYIRLYYNASIENKYDISNLVYYFKRHKYSKALKINLSFIFRMVIPTFIFFIPAIIYLTLGIVLKFNEASFFSIILGILIFLSSLITVIYSLKYFIAFTYVNENEDLRTRDYFEFSKAAMSGKVVDLIKLFFSYFPWVLLSLTVLPLLYVVPYMTQGFMISAKWITLLQKEISYNESIPMYNSVQ